MNFNPQESLLKSLGWLQTLSEYSDLKIFCGDDVFRVHKAIICPRSEYFSTSCRWGKDGRSKEEITFEDEDPQFIRLMLDYLYQLDYDDLTPSKDATTDEVPQAPESPVAKSVMLYESLEEPSRATVHEGFTKKKKKKSRKPGLQLRNSGLDPDSERLTTNAKMYSLADKFGIEELKTLAKIKFDEAMEQDWDSGAFVHAAELVFDSTPSSDQGLRDTVAYALNNHRELVNYEQVQGLLDSGNGMAWAFVKALLDVPI